MTRALARILPVAVAIAIVSCGTGYSTAPSETPDAGTPGCATYTCGTLCVAPDDPAFGCSAARNCQACPGPANGTSTCASGACAIACVAPFLDCDKDITNGCEIESTSDPENCGSCGHRCDASAPYCVNGSCSENCPLTICGTLCVDPTTSLANCGGCGTRCLTPPGGNGTASCKASKCHYDCSAGYAECDTNERNGCEAFVGGNDPAHCGGCNACPSPPNTVPKCTAGACSFSCKDTTADCDGKIVNGCECTLGGGTICRSDMTCSKCSDPSAPCGKPSDCCGALNQCVNALCCRAVGGACTIGTDCCNGKCNGVTCDP